MAESMTERTSITPATRLPVPLLDLRAQYATIRDEVRAAVDAVLESQSFILGSEVEALEREVAAYSQCEYGIGVSSGTDALLVSLMALDIGPGDEVITSSYSFFATAGVISRVGARPVFVDIDPLTYNMDPDALESAVTGSTRAIIPVHLYGQAADMEPIMDVARAHDLYVIEDAAQAIGSEYRGRRAGSMGHLGCFSFFPSKNLGGIGDGGMVTTRDQDLAERVRLLRNHGFGPKYYNRVVGANFRLDAIQAAVLRVKLRYLDGWTEGRQHNADTYRRLFHEAELGASPDAQRAGFEMPGVGLPAAMEDRRHIYNQFVVRVDRRDALREHLKDRQIGTEIYYPVPLHLQECFADLGYKTGDLPVSEQASLDSLALPIYPELTTEMMAAVVAAIADFHGPG